ncbi:MAG: SDR family oxidoreductase [Burkholderiaceae bacterium]|nr:SDR family oxidoreductase [Burkholderiaceae bacterium]MDO9090680.1 SDR family oxidoreductase [Burkholderiaceae bacterium]
MNTPSSMVLDKHVVLVTGAAGGIGRAMVKGLMEAGATVVAVDVSSESLAELEQQALKIRSGKLVCHAADLSREQACAGAVAFAVDSFGRIDAVVNNAGIARLAIKPNFFQEPPKFWDISGALWQKFFDINASAVFHMMKCALPHMVGNARGRIVNVTTSLDSMLVGGMSPYGPSKAASESLSSIAAAELKGSGVTVNVLLPGGTTDTPMIPPDAPFDRDDLLPPTVMVPPLIWLLSDAGSKTTGMRFRANMWDTTMDAEQAAAQAGAPIGWMAIAAGQYRAPRRKVEAAG